MPAADLGAKRALHPPLKALRAWTDVPRPGTYVEDWKLNHLANTDHKYDALDDRETMDDTPLVDPFAAPGAAPVASIARASSR